MFPSIPPMQVRMEAGAESLNCFSETISVSKVKGHAVAALVFSAAMAACALFSVNGETVIWFCWYWICRALISKMPFNGVVTL